MGVGVEGHHLRAEEVLQERERPPARGVVGVGDPPRPVGALDHDVVPEDRVADAVHQRRLGSSGSGARDPAGPRMPSGYAGCRVRRGTMGPVTAVPDVVEESETQVGAGSPLGDRRVERPGQPDGVRDARLHDVLRIRPRQGHALMLDVHNEGRAAVSNGSREEMERDVQAMHAYGLWATLVKDD